MVNDLVNSVERARDGVIAVVADLRPDQAMFKASPDEWSIVENVEHLYLAEISFHMERHVDQIRRLQARPDYPR